MNKKAFELQFNWLFVLVAGAAIILFFTVVVIKQKNVAETSTKATLLKSIEAIITGASVSQDTINKVDIPDSNIAVECGRISIGGISKQQQDMILFAPSLIKGDKLVTQTLAFNAPFRATNLLYITSPQIRYIIIGNSNLAREINKTLPSELKKESYHSQPEIKNSNNYKVRFIVFGEMIEFPKPLSNMPDEDVSAIRVNGDLEKGTIEFWQKDGSSWLSKGISIYIGRSSLAGAAYADTIEAYKCNMQNAFTRLNFVSKIYIERTNKLVRETSSSRQAQCNQFYKTALTHLSSINSASSEFNSEKIDLISESAKSLAVENKNAQIYSCTLIY